MRPTPFRAVPPRSGRQWTVVDADGKEVCECDGLEDGAEEAAFLVAAVNGAQDIRDAVVLMDRAYAHDRSATIEAANHVLRRARAL